ncbi:S1/P1 nuclease-domain-containing protein [Naematelia encephala]|uniref:S1/P1 nuclease-domain-containing protein n=1 Tax=Naematelia encephala TaxID=71784 RepID=A0A1Y2BGW7_9TREE|nr:S1/P1 nuclease-domain-containing protein [Naematelia encephala]
MRLFLTTIAIASLLPTVLSWGAAGHEIVATIAQIHLHPSTRQKLCGILPPEARCHLAPIAAWADQVRNRYRGTAPMHYVNAKSDHPADHCEFGEHGWMDEDVNVLTAIANMTQLVMDGKGDIPLRFLVHFMGDLHQPLHLAGRDKGGNGAMFLFEGHHRNLHSVWDSGIITKNIRELSNYTSPLPSKQIESALLGAIFDPYVRFIVWEGIREWWRDDFPSWLSCPPSGDPYPHSSNSDIPPSAPSFLHILRSATSLVLNIIPEKFIAPLTLAFPIPLEETHELPNKLLSLHPDKEGNHTSFPACPYTWAKELHQINCDIAWPAEYTGIPGEPLIELDTDQYLGRLKREKTVEKLLAMAGLRLASVVNEALGEGAYGALNFDYRA